MRVFGLGIGNAGTADVLRQLGLDGDMADLSPAARRLRSSSANLSALASSFASYKLGVRLAVRRSVLEPEDDDHGCRIVKKGQ